MSKEPEIQKYESHIARIEDDLAKAREIIRQHEEAADGGECVEYGDVLPREAFGINAAFQMIGMCQSVLHGRHVCGESGCGIARRELKPEEGAAFSAACDMLSRFFDNEFKLDPGCSPEAEDVE